jgi:hypothetical protein
MPAELSMQHPMKMILIFCSGLPWSIVVEKLQHPFVITTGFPLSTYNIYKPVAEQYLGKRHFMVTYDTHTFNLKGGVRKNTFEIDLHDVIPEIVGCIIGLKKNDPNADKENLIALNFGFGTVEGAMATREGLIHRTSFSSHGIRYVIGNLTRELGQKHSLDMKNEHQMDDAFSKGYLFTKRKKNRSAAYQEGVVIAIL